ncbi:hypothetical protein PGT21_009411 [Puccinia graminis f. sp. tritici]|uniref:Uncharacterized protein n=1 Tax=Puccinia graminis f. sp. tritici TaxID=56615 RepID=A0A5B0MTA0_PUCGR|nr:hypothetical protein PGT21_009411 [Puccinia graminis f. sp. tritici]
MRSRDIGAVACAVVTIELDNKCRQARAVTGELASRRLCMDSDVHPSGRPAWPGNHDRTKHQATPFVIRLPPCNPELRNTRLGSKPPPDEVPDSSLQPSWALAGRCSCGHSPFNDDDGVDDDDVEVDQSLLLFISNTSSSSNL